MPLPSTQTLAVTNAALFALTAPLDPTPGKPRRVRVQLANRHAALTLYLTRSDGVAGTATAFDVPPLTTRQFTVNLVADEATLAVTASGAGPATCHASVTDLGGAQGMSGDLLTVEQSVEELQADHADSDTQHTEVALTMAADGGAPVDLLEVVGAPIEATLFHMREVAVAGNADSTDLVVDDDSGNLTFLDAVATAAANFPGAPAQVWNAGRWTLPVGTIIRATPVGTAATPHNKILTVSWNAKNDVGRLQPA